MIRQDLQQLRRKYWDERRTKRSELYKLLSGNNDEETDGMPDKSLHKEHHPIYKLQKACDFDRDTIITHCTSLNLLEPMISCLTQKFENLSQAFIWCCENNCVKLAEYLFNESEARRINSNSSDNSAFRGACSKGNHEIVSLFLRETESKQIDSAINSGFLCACESGNHKTIALFLEESVLKRFDINFTTGFHLSCFYGSTKTISLFFEDLVAEKINYNYKDRKGNSGFHLACSRDIHEIVACFFKSPGKTRILFNLQDSNGHTGFDLVCALGNPKTVALFLEESIGMGIDISTKSRRDFEIVQSTLAQINNKNTGED